MRGGSYCPHCGKAHDCTCKNCSTEPAENELEKYIDEVKGVMECQYCGEQYTQDMSLDYEMKLSGGD